MKKREEKCAMCSSWQQTRNKQWTPDDHNDDLANRKDQVHNRI